MGHRFIFLSLIKSKTSHLVLDTRREAQLANDISAPSKLNVLEFDSRDWKIEEKKEPYIGWLPGLPRPDGIFVCYDGSDVSSFEDIVQLLGT